MGEQGAVDWTEDTSPWSSSVSDIANPVCLGSASQEVMEPVTEGGVQAKSAQFIGEFLGVTEGRTVVHRDYPDLGVFVLQFGKGVLEGGARLSLQSLRQVGELSLGMRAIVGF